MEEAKIEQLKVNPAFDLMEFLDLAQERRIEGKAAEKLETLWNIWSPLLKACKVTCGKIGYLTVWLPESVESEVDKLWGETPSEGYLANVLAQYLCMQVVGECLPQVEISSCAPAPRPTESLRKALGTLGLSYRDDMPVLERRFAVVTYLPFKGGCEICFLQDKCPKGRGGEDASSVVLPGYEHPGTNQ